jgi:hypothetical protein
VSTNLIRVRRAKWRTKPRTRSTRYNWIVVDSRRFLFSSAPRLGYTQEFIYRSHSAALRAADSLARHDVLRPKDLVGVNIHWVSVRDRAIAVGGS